VFGASGIFSAGVVLPFRRTGPLNPLPDARSFRPALFGAILLIAACGEPTEPRPVDANLNADWRTGSPASQDIDPTTIQNAVTHAKTLPRLLSLLVVRNGVLVVEEYFNGNFADSLNDGRSVTKSVMSTLVGVALHQGLLPSLSERLDTHLSPAYLDGLAADTRAISFRDLLTMSGGFEWHETDGTLPDNAEYNAWVLSPDPVAFVLARPIVAAPGTRFNYNSAGIHLMSVMLTSALGKPLADFAREELFQPLGISRQRWELFPDGTPNGGAGLRLRPRDFAKIGALWLQRGETGRTTLLDGGYVDAGTSSRFELVTPPTALTGCGYGYSWWTARTPYGNGFFAWGFGGQFIFVVPARSLVVVVTTEWRNSAGLGLQLEANGLDLIVNHVLPAVR
jgi:CubicO group peptidase (beta-lactamase class C family)